MYMSHDKTPCHQQARTLLETPKIKCDVCLLPKPFSYRYKKRNAYTCNNCSKLPREIFHWLHPQHPLSVNNIRGKRGVCEGCKYFFWCALYYKCKQCGFRLCVECVSTRTSRRLLQWESKDLIHYSHFHELARCRFKEEVQNQRCNICSLQMWGVGYACAKCKHFVHETCIDTPQIIMHPFHQLHPLKRLDYAFDKKMLSTSRMYVLMHRERFLHMTCGVCNGHFPDQDKIHFFNCEECKIYLHSQCADSFLRPVKLESHQHSLFYCLARKVLIFFETSTCHNCGDSIKKWTSSFFCCVKCGLSFHFKCASIPQSFKHKHHQHGLALMSPFNEYSSEEYYCDICDARRDPDSHAYYCKQCKFFGHIECVLSKEEDFPKFLSDLLTTEMKKDHDPGCSSKHQIQQACHDHPLTMSFFRGQQCKICHLEIEGQAYQCKMCKDFSVHEKCAAMPKDLDHPLHPTHKLTLCNDNQIKHYGEYFICDICRTISKGFNFTCRTCEFVIDIKCAIATKGENPTDEKDYIKLFKHIFHDHELKLANNKEIHWMYCNVCDENAYGLTYWCMRCSFTAHRACLNWPHLVEQHPLLPDHVLELGAFYRPFMCFACGDNLKRFGYQSQNPKLDSKIAFHLECGTSLARLLEYQHSDHHLYYFNSRPFKQIICAICEGMITGSYYRCRKCKLHFHLKCLRLPSTAKHKSHLHWLTFKDSVDFGEYYCDICEEPKDFQHPVYCCRECELVSCVNCIVSQMKPSASASESRTGGSEKGSKKNIGCPNGTVPILRIRKEDLVIAQQFAERHFNPLSADNPATHTAAMKSPAATKYHGVTADMSGHQLNIGGNQASYAQIFVGGGANRQDNFIQAGWMINPSVFGDGRIWSFGLWKGKGGSGCCNTACQGFVQGAQNDPLSEPMDVNMPSPFLRISIHQDKRTGNWWITQILKTRAIDIGYWPKKLFDFINDGTTLVGFGGFVHLSLPGPSPPMGNGHLPTGKPADSAVFRNLGIWNANYIRLEADDFPLQRMVDSEKCYNLDFKGYGNRDVGVFFLYGGPGGDTCGV